MLTVSYVDTCTPDYLTDHYTREGECLIGVALSSDMTVAQVIEQLIRDAHDNGDTIPAQYGHAEIDACVRSTITTSDKRWSPYPVVSDEDGEEAFAWFVFRF